MTATRQGPLSRFKVIDLTRARAGPTAARQFADWGADVIKVEMPQEGDEDRMMGGSREGPTSSTCTATSARSRSTCRRRRPRGLLPQLVRDADVVVENFRADVKHRLKVDYETLRGSTRGIVYGSISGFGQDGPYGKRPGVDQIAQGLGGLMSVTGPPGSGPWRVGVPISDLCAGLYLAHGVMAALIERDVSGEGQWVQTSLLEAHGRRCSTSRPRAG